MDPLALGSAGAENGWIPTSDGVVQPYPAPDSTEADSYEYAEDVERR